MDYGKESTVFKALCEPTRLRILDMLSCGEMCACQLLDGLSISQSTLSHHMKVLMECDLVNGRKDATWMYYTINRQSVQKLHQCIDLLTNEKKDCICFSVKSKCEDCMPTSK